MEEMIENGYKKAIADSMNDGPFNVEYTIVKVVKLVNANKNQINSLLTDPNVRSINIVKNENTNNCGA